MPLSALYALYALALSMMFARDARKRAACECVSDAKAAVFFTAMLMFKVARAHDAAAILRDMVKAR